MGDHEEGASVIQPLKDLGPEVDLIQPMPYSGAQTMIDVLYPKGYRNYWKAQYLPAIEDELIDTIHGNDDPGITDRTIDVHLGRLRRKLGDDAASPRFVATVRSAGYKFIGPVEQRRSAP